jgi:ribosome-binding factor A
MPARRYPRTARVNQVLREVLADALERVSDDDERLAMITVTGVEVDPDLRHAIVFYDGGSRPADVADALAEQRVRLQASIGRQVRMKFTPQLSFVADPAVSSGVEVESILRRLRDDDRH